MTVCDDVQIKYTGDGSAVLFTFPFEYEKQSDVKVGFLNEDNGRYEEVAQDDANHPWSFENATTIRFTTAPTEEFKIYRSTAVQFAVFAPGSAVRAQDLNKNFDEIDMLVEEAKCGTNNAIDYVDENYWDKHDDTYKHGSGDDDHIGTVAWNDDRYLNIAGGDIVTEEEQIAGTAAIDNEHVFSTAASAKRHDNILDVSDPGAPQQPGKIWINTSNEETQYWNDAIGAWVDNSKVGPVGPKGEKGDSGTVTVGQTNTSAPGGDAQVTNTGTPTDAVLNFTIPRGEQGPEGPVGPTGPAGAGVVVRGQVDATNPNTAPVDPEVGDLWINTGSGTVDASWGAPAGLTIENGWTLVYSADNDWLLNEPALAADLWEINGSGGITSIASRPPHTQFQYSAGGTDANPALALRGDAQDVNTGINIPVAGTLGLQTNGGTRATVNDDGIQVGPAIELQGTNETIVVGNMRIDTNQINHVGQWSIDINNNDLMVFRDNDITTIEDLDVEGTAQPGFALNLAEGNVYRIDVINPGDEAWWESVGATATPQVGQYFTSTSSEAVRANNNVTWVLDPANLHVAGDLTVGGNIITAGAASSVDVSELPPQNPEEGDLWWNTIEGELFIWYEDTDGPQWVQANGGSRDLTEFINVNGAAPTPSMSIDANGNVGIGTTNPNVPLTVDSDSGSSFAIRAASDTNLRLQMGFDHTNDYARISSEEAGVNQKDIFQHALNHRWGRNNSTEFMRISQAGALGFSGANYGNAGQVLTSQGNGAPPQWVDGGGGSGSTHITITSANSSHVVMGAPPEASTVQFSFRSLDLDSTNSGLEMRFGNAGGATDTTNSYAWMGRRLGGPELSDRNMTDNSIRLVSSGHAVGSNSSYVGVVTITRCGTDGYNVSWTLSAGSNSATQIVGNGYYTGTWDVESVTLLAQTGNITAGRMAISWS